MKEIELLAYSGGDVARKTDEMNYCQFIGIDKATGDTIRVLSAAIAVEGAADDGKPMFTPSTTYDFDKGIREAAFRVPTDGDKMMLGMMPQLQGEQPDPTKLNAGSGSTAVKGILSFKEQPW